MQSAREGSTTEISDVFWKLLPPHTYLEKRGDLAAQAWLPKVKPRGQAHKDDSHTSSPTKSRTTDLPERMSGGRASVLATRRAKEPRFRTMSFPATSLAEFQEDSSLWSMPMILQNRFNETACLDARLEKMEKEGVAYVRLIPSEAAGHQNACLPLRNVHTFGSMQAGVFLLWFVEFWVFMALPVIIIIMALHPQLFCLTGCAPNGGPLP